MVDPCCQYLGRELENFAAVVNWKRYWASMILPYLGNRVLEVGAGIGSSTRILLEMSAADHWLCLEPDPEHIRLLRTAQAEGRIPRRCALRQGTLAEIEPGERFDSILYIDVLEHIEDDASEIEAAAGHLSTGGHLIILAPACPWLFSEFDRAIGHHRRYTRAMFASDYGDTLRITSARYLDCVGLLASLGNRLVLHASLPSTRQLAFWDRWLVPISRQIDWLFRYRCGRSILVIYQHTRQGPGS